MMNRFSKLLQLIERQCSWSGGSSRKKASRYERRRLFLEPLQPREVLAVAIDAFTPTPSGFTVELSNEIQQSVLNLYDTESHALGAADVTLTGNVTGNVSGSLVVAGTKLTFIATGGALPADTYTVTMRSAADGIVDQTLGESLDGEFDGAFPTGNGVAGGDFVTTFSVSANPLVVSIPDFARGPTQSVQVPAMGSGVELPAGLPIQFSDANGVTSFTLTITYDPALLSITGAELGPDAPSGSQVETNVTVPGQATIAFFSLEPMSSGAADLVNLIAEVPEAATYGATQVVDITFLEVNAGGLQATADDAVHVVAFPGDANANRRYDAEDARLIARTGIGLDSGFVTSTPTSTSTTNLLYPRTDAVIIGDVTGVDGLSPLDASDVLRRVVGLSTPNIPALPDAQGPTSLSLSATSIAESQPAGTAVGSFSTVDPDAGDTHTYSLVSGDGDTDNALFTISGSTLLTAVEFDHAVQDTLTIRVRTTDSTGRTLDNTFTITVTDINEAPTSIAISNNTVAEDIAIGTAIGTLTSTDPDSGNTHTYSLVFGNGDTDNTSFVISGDQLLVAATLDFEAKSSYSARIRSTDQGGLSVDQILTIAVTNVNEAPTSVSLSNSSIEEAEPVATLVGMLTSTDQDAGDTHVYSFVTGDGDTDNASFTISGDQLLTAEVFEHATQSSYSIRVQSTDVGGLTAEQVITISVLEINAAPTAIALSNTTVDENVVVGTVVGSFSTTDANASDTHTYALVAGDGDTNNAAFTITNDQLQTAAAIDFETQSSYSIRVRSTDPFGLFVEEMLTITVNDLQNEAPTAVTLSNDTLAEDAAIGSIVGTLSSTDENDGDTHTYSFVTGEGDADNGSFVIVGDELQTGVPLDFETQDTYSIRIQSTDQGGLSVEQILTINVTNVNEAPTAIVVTPSSVAEGEPVDTLVGSLATTDPDIDDTHTYSLIAGDGDTDNASFTIDGDQLKTTDVFNQATKSSYSIRVESMDAGGLAIEQTLMISVTETNVAPTTLALSNASVDENVELGTVVGTFSTSDANTSDTHTYTLAAGEGDTDNAAFTIVGDALQTAADIDFETQDSYSIRVRSTDRFGLFVEEMLTITVNDLLNEAPTSITLSNDTISEDAVSGAVVGTLSTTDPDAGDTHTYMLVAGDGDTDNASFEIIGDAVQTTVTLDFETQETYSIRVQSMDQGGLTVEQMLTITVTNVNEVPTLIAISSATVAQAEPVGTLVGMLTTTDTDAGDMHTYSLAAGEGDMDNASFTISGDQLQTAEVFDQSTKDTYSVRVQSMDAGGLTFEQVLTITITETNVAPTALTLNNLTADENSELGTLVGTFITTDANATDTHTYEFVAGDGDADNASFTIDGDTLQTATAIDFETQASYSIRVQSTDLYGLSVEEMFTITVNDLNEAPTEFALSNDTIAEDAAIGTVVGAFSTIDQDDSNTHTYSLVAGEGDSDNSSFFISGGELQTAVTLDFETQETFSVRVQSMDQGGLSVEQMLTITVTNVNETPTVVELSKATVAESEPVGTLVGALTTADPDAGDTHTYVLVVGEGDTDNASFTVSGDELLTAESFDQATQSSYSIRVQSTDAGGLIVEQVLTITITEANVAPAAIELNDTAIDENSELGSVVGTLSTTDANATDTHTYELVAGDGDTDNALFSIDGDQLLTAAEVDFEMQDSYSVRIKSTDPFGLSVEQTMTITVNDLNEAPTEVTLSNDTVAEDAVAGTTVGTLSTIDVDAGDTHTYRLIAGDGDTDNALFTIVGDELQTAVTFDFEAQNTFSVHVQSIDSGGLAVEQTFVITVSDVNDAPTSIELSNASVAEGEPVGTAVGTLTSTDQDGGDTHAYAFVAGDGDADNASFTISGDQLLTNAIFDQATQSSYSIRVQSMDAVGLTVEQVLTITIREVNVAPTAVALSNAAVDENADVDETVGTLSTADANAGDTHTYELVAGEGDTDNSLFAIAVDQLLADASFDFEMQDSYSIRVRSTDSFGLSVDEMLMISINDLNESPTDLMLSNDTVAEDTLIGATFGLLTTTDPDTVNTHTYSLVAGDGDTDNASFEVVGDELRTTVALDFATQQSYSIRVQSMDQGGEFFEKILTVFVTEVIV